MPRAQEKVAEASPGSLGFPVTLSGISAGSELRAKAGTAVSFAATPGSFQNPNQGLCSHRASRMPRREARRARTQASKTPRLLVQLALLWDASCLVQACPRFFWSPPWPQSLALDHKMSKGKALPAGGPGVGPADPHQPHSYRYPCLPRQAESTGPGSAFSSSNLGVWPRIVIPTHTLRLNLAVYADLGGL